MIAANGTKTVTAAGTSERLIDQPLGAFAQLDITALSDNTDKVFVGDRNVSSTSGQELTVTALQGDTITLANQDPYDVWIDVATAAEGVKWLAMN